MDGHVCNVVRGCNYHIRALRHIRPLLDLDTAKVLAHGIDYCNSLMCGMSNRNFKRLQVTQYALARAVCSAPWSTSATELCRWLHWLPLRQRVDYRLALITITARRTGYPVHIASLLNEYRSTRTLRSSDELLFTIPFCRLPLGLISSFVLQKQLSNATVYKIRKHTVKYRLQIVHNER